MTLAPRSAIIYASTRCFKSASQFHPARLLQWLRNAVIHASVTNVIVQSTIHTAGLRTSATDAYK